MKAVRCTKVESEGSPLPSLLEAASESLLPTKVGSGCFLASSVFVSALPLSSHFSRFSITLMLFLTLR